MRSLDFRFRKIVEDLKPERWTGICSRGCLSPRSQVDEKRRTLQEVCELATKEHDGDRLGELIEEILELLAEAQDRNKLSPPNQ